MAAAVELAERGVPVTVFEASRTLGGRARRVEVNGVALDNGLHILIGAYRETLRLIAKVSGATRFGLLRQTARLCTSWASSGCVRHRCPLRCTWLWHCCVRRD